MRSKREDIVDWAEVRRAYEAGANRRACQELFGFSDWDWHAAVGRGEIVPRLRGTPSYPSTRKRAMIAELRADGLSYGEISRKLGISKATVAYHARRLGIAADDKCARRYDWTEVQRAIDTGATVRELIERFGFARASYSKAVKRGEVIPRDRLIPLEELLVVGRHTSRSHLKARLIGAGLKHNRCEECGISEWRGKPLSIELHHVNGKKLDNRLENLKMLCGNCHSQTHTWGGRNAERAKAA